MEGDTQMTSISNVGTQERKKRNRYGESKILIIIHQDLVITGTKNP